MTTAPFPPDKPIFSFYGDDFTGSTDALEALATSDVSAVLYLRPPDAEDLSKFPGVRAVGIAGESRSRSPQWMRENLPVIFERLREIGAPVVQYKVCSTFDSSPNTGSIGCAIEIGKQVFANRAVGVVPAAPQLDRWVVFGNLFAAGGDGIHRIDRHPAMRQHPITPMGEGDLLLHLACQTALRIAGVPLLELRRNEPAWPLDADVILFDGLEPADMAQAARRIWEHRSGQQTFAVGSSGLTYGLLDYWRSQGWLPDRRLPRDAALPNQGRVLVLAGSCSPATQDQICSALRAGFHGIQLNPANWSAAATQAEAVSQLGAGRSVVLYLAQGAADRMDIQDQPVIAAAMGQLLRNVILESGVSRVVVAGGDTSTHAVRELGISALTFAAPLTRGAPLCRAHGWPGELQLVLKGGQIGSEHFFEEALFYPEAP